MFSSRLHQRLQLGHRQLLRVVVAGIRKALGHSLQFGALQKCLGRLYHEVAIEFERVARLVRRNQHLVQLLARPDADDRALRTRGAMAGPGP